MIIDANNPDHRFSLYIKVFDKDGAELPYVASIDTETLEWEGWEKTASADERSQMVQARGVAGSIRWAPYVTEGMRLEMVKWNASLSSVQLPHPLFHQLDEAGQCTVCKAIGPELATNCPGVALSETRRRSVAEGRADFVDGNWVEHAHVWLLTRTEPYGGGGGTDTIGIFVDDSLSLEAAKCQLLPIIRDDLGDRAQSTTPNSQIVGGGRWTSTWNTKLGPVFYSATRMEVRNMRL